MPRYEDEQDREARADYEAEMARDAGAELPPLPACLGVRRFDYRSDERFTTLEHSAPNSDD